MRKHSPGNVQHPVGKSLTYGGCRETTLLFTEVNPIEQTANWGLGLMTLSQAEVVPCFSYSLSDITGTWKIQSPYCKPYSKERIHINGS